jgi:uncharacterized protein (DUF3820 family)
MEKRMEPEQARAVITAGLQHVIQKRESCQLRMPFGKYNGTPVAKLPDSYLKWAASVEWIRGPLRKAIQEECRQRREKEKQMKDAVLAAFQMKEFE